MYPIIFCMLWRQKYLIINLNLIISCKPTLATSKKKISFTPNICDISHLKETNLNIQWKTVESHWTNECYSGGNCIHYLKISVQPETFQFRQNIESLKLFKV